MFIMRFYVSLIIGVEIDDIMEMISSMTWNVGKSCVTFLYSQCTPGNFNLEQKFHGLSCFLSIGIHETVQNQSIKTSVIKLPQFTTVIMAKKCHQRASFSMENLFFEHYSSGSLMTDVFID